MDQALFYILVPTIITLGGLLAIAMCISFVKPFCGSTLREVPLEESESESEETSSESECEYESA